MVLAEVLGPSRVPRPRQDLRHRRRRGGARARPAGRLHRARGRGRAARAARALLRARPAAATSFRKDLRRVVIFGRNDLVQDAPISRIDLLVCRNTLMYFNAETQARILRRFHFALRRDGVLFLGKAEMLLSHAELFRRSTSSAGSSARSPHATPRPRSASWRRRSPRSRRPSRARLDTLRERRSTRRAGRAGRGRPRTARSRWSTTAGRAAVRARPPATSAARSSDLEVSYRPSSCARHIEQAQPSGAPIAGHATWRCSRGQRAARSTSRSAPLVDADGELARRDRVIFHDVTDVPPAAGRARAGQPRSWRRPTRSCSPPTRSWRPPTRSSSRRSRSSRPPTRSSSPPTRSSRR